MTEPNNEQFLDACAHAFVVFAELHPEYKQTEAEARRMAAELTASGLSPANPDHLSAVWLRIRPRVPAPVAPEPEVAESTDPIEVEANRLLSSGEVTVQSVRAMSSHELEMRIRNSAFCRALELLPKPVPEPIRTRGDIVREKVIIERASKNGVAPVLDYNPAVEVERSRRAVSEGFANHSEPTRPQGGVPHFSGVSFGDRAQRGFTNPGKDIPLPKSPNAAAAIEQERKDHKWLEEQRAKSARAVRVRAHRNR